MLSGTPNQREAVKEFVEMLPKLMAMIEIICPEMPKPDRTLVG